MFTKILLLRKQIALWDFAKCMTVKNVTSEDGVNKISKFAVAINIKLRVRATCRVVTACYHIAVDSITGRRLERRGRGVVDTLPDAANNRVTGWRGPRHAVSSINPRRIVHFRFRRESRLTRKIRLDRARRNHPVEGPMTTAVARRWNGLAQRPLRGAG